jgi:TIR domain
MNFEEALEFIENLVYTKTGKHLSDLERKVFVGSWQGLTYEQIYPLNPEYVEKDVGFKLWRKLTKVLGDKVTKKMLQGTIERARQELLQAESRNNKIERLPETRKVFISYCSQEPDLSLAVELSQGIAAAGHQVFMANIGAVYAHQKSAKDCLSQIDIQLEQCEYFLLLLSEQTAVSEIVIEELRRIKKMRDCRQKPEPMVLPIRVNYPASIPLTTSCC